MCVEEGTQGKKQNVGNGGNGRRRVVKDVVNAAVKAALAVSLFWQVPALATPPVLVSTDRDATVPPGAIASYSIRLNSTGGTGEVRLTAAGLPAGAAYTIAPSAMTSPGTAVLRVVTAGTTPVGSSRITITATRGTESGTTSVDLSVRPDADFALVAPEFATRQTLVEDAFFPLRVTGRQGANPEITLSVIGLPAGYTAVFQPSEIVRTNSTVMLRVTAPKQAVAGPLSFQVAGRSGSVSRTATVKANTVAPTYRIHRSSRPGSLRPGSSMTQWVAIAPSFGFDGTVELGATGLPPGVTAQFEPRTIRKAGFSKLTLTAAPNARVSKMQFNVTGRIVTGGQRSAAAVRAAEGSGAGVTLSVGEPDFDLSVTPATRSNLPGQTSRFTVAIRPLDGFASAVSLSLPGLPEGFTAQFAQTTLSGESSTELQVTTPANLPYGTYLLNVVGTGGSITNTEPITLTISDDPGITLYTTPRVILSPHNQTVNAKIELAALNRFSGTVGLAVGGLPDGVVATLGSTSLTVNATHQVNLALAVPAGVPAGTYPITVMGVTNQESVVYEGSLLVTPRLPAPWSSRDIGPVVTPGSGGMDAVTGLATIQASGTSEWWWNDTLHYLSQPMPSDAEIAVRVTGIQDSGSNMVSRVGLMMRESVDPLARMVFVYVDKWGVPGVQHRYWPNVGYGPEARMAAVRFPYWLKLVRTGDVVTAYGSGNGTNWTIIGTPMTLAVGSLASIGLGATAGNQFSPYSAAITGTYDNLRLTNGASFRLTGNPVPGTEAGKAKYGIQVAPVSGFTGAVSLSASGGPPGTTYEFTPATVSSGSSELVVTPPAGQTGTWSISVTGVSGSTSKTIAFPLTVGNTGTRIWISTDIGAVFNTGSLTAVSGTSYSLTFSGDDNPEGFQYAHQMLSGDGQIVARLSGFANLGVGNSSAGIMIRGGLEPQSPFAGLRFESAPGPGHWVSWRGSTGASPAQVRFTGAAAPYWLRLVRAGSQITASISSDGLNWTQVGSPVTVALPNTVYAGLFGFGEVGGSLVNANFENVSITGNANPGVTDFQISAVPPPVIRSGEITYTLASAANASFAGTIGMSVSGLPAGATGTFLPSSIPGNGQTQLRVSVPAGTASGVSTISATGTSGAIVRTVPLSLITHGNPAQAWTSNDVGSPSAAGTTALSSGTWTLTGGGGQIFDTYNGPDAHSFAYSAISGDGHLTARLVSRTAAAGIMVRESLDPKAKGIFLGFHNDGRFVVVTRQATGGNTDRLDQGMPIPLWLRFTRAGGSLRLFTSTDGVNWGGFASYDFGLSGDLLLGLAVSSGTAVFDSVSVSGGSDFQMTATPIAVDAASGSSVSFKVTSGAWGGFASPVALSATGLPPGATHSFTPATIPGAGSSTLNVTLAPGTAVGAYGVTVTGTSGVVARSARTDLFHGATPPRAWVHQDVGYTGRAGSASFDGNVFTVLGSGEFLSDTNGNPDAYSNVSTSVSGDFVFSARVVTRSWGHTGILVRDGLDTKGKSVAVLVNSNGNVYLASRPVFNQAATLLNGGQAPLARWLRLRRTGSTFTGEHSGDGLNWTVIGSTTVSMGADLYAGLAVCSQWRIWLSASTIDNLSLTNPADFSITATPSTQNATVGMTAPVAVTLMPTAGFASPVSLSVSGVPAGVSPLFSSQTVTPALPMSTLSLMIGSGTAPGTYPMIVTGTAGAVTRTAATTLVVGGTDFNLSLNNTSRTVAPGGSSTIVATIQAVGAFRGDVAFSAMGLPPGVAMQFSPASIRGGGVSTATIRASGQAPLGTSTVTVTATSAGVTKSQTFALTVSNVSDFELKSTVTSRMVTPGAIADIPFTVDAIGGFNSQVELQVAGLPTGATALIEPSSLIPPAAANLRVTAGASTPRGTFPLTISGTSGSVRRTLRVDLVISTAADYTLTLGPASATVNAGQTATYTLGVAGAANFSGTLVFDAINLPDGAAATFQPASLTQPGNVTVTVTTSAASAQANAQAFYVTGTTGGVTKESNAAALTINTTATFSVSASPTTVIVGQTGVARFPVTVSGSGGFASSVSLSSTGAPAGSVIAFDPPVIAGGSGSSTLSIQVPATAVAQDYALTITGIGGNQTKNAPATLVVRTAASFEAESPANTLTGSTAANCSTCSNGQRVDGIGKHGAGAAGTLRFNGVNAPASGLYALNVYYANPDKTPRSASVVVNGLATNLSFVGNTTGSLSAVTFATVQVYLVSGANTIEFQNAVTPSPSIDRITIMNTAQCTLSAVDVAHVIDCSGSVGGQPFADAKNAAKQFIDRMQLAQDKIAVVSFTNTGVVRQQLTQTASLAKSAIDALVSGGSTSIAAGINAANTELASVRHTPTAQKVMILMSDGQNTTGSDPVTAANTAKAAGVRLITIGYGTHNAPVLTSLASSPSDYYAAPTGTQIYAVYDSVATSVCRKPNEAPISMMGPRQAVPVGQFVSLVGAVSDDGQPTASILTVTWSMVSGPGTVSFSNAGTANTTASFSAAGDYVLQLAVSDGELSSSSTFTIRAMASGWDLEAEGINTTLSGGATVVPCANCSGGARVDQIGNHGPGRNGSVTFTVTAPANGTYSLRVYYTNGDTSPRTANVSINGDTSPRSFTAGPTGSWDTVANALMTAPLVTGTNTVRFYNDLAPAPSIDRIELVVAGSGTLLSTIASSPGDAFTAPAPGDLLPAIGNAGLGLCRPLNAAPSVFAGPDLNGNMGIALRIRGSASDDGLPGAPAVLTVNWSKITGPGNVSFSNVSSPSTDAMFDAPGTYVLQLAASDSVLNATSRVTVGVGGTLSTHRLQITPSAAGPLLAGTAQVFEAKVTTTAGDPVSSVALQFTVSGGNTYTANGTTNTAGIATFSYSGTNTGLDTARVAATALAGVNPVSASVAWVRPAANVALAPVTARFFPADNTGVFNTAPAQQPALTEILTSISINPAAQPYTGGPAGDANRSPAAAMLGDVVSNYIGNVPIAGNGFATTTGTNANPWSAVLTGNLIVKTAGQYTLVADLEGVMILGVGGGATRVSGPMDGAPVSGMTAFANLPVMGARNVATAQPNQQAVQINFPTAGVYPFEFDYRRTDTRQGFFVRYRETSIQRPLPPVVVLKITPVESLTKTRGEVVTVTVRASNETDGPIAGQPVTLTVTGANPQQLQAATDTQGIATFQYAGQVAGFTDTLRASMTYGAAQVRSATARVTWNTGVNQAPLVSSGPPSTITIPGAATLLGSVTDDGLPAGSTLNIQWSQVSGPGTTTFDNLRSPQTQATFSQPGSYVLRLTASDGALSSNAEVTVGVNAEPTTLGGWIATPVHLSTITGTVDIT
ncbi:MAG: VWA domain-containing protein, partial [Bryobacterales bacterium]|nr:VWA domain-containing protein [Bryobacterales bacterium]